MSAHPYELTDADAPPTAEELAAAANVASIAAVDSNGPLMLDGARNAPALGIVATGPVFMSDDWDVEDERIEPTLLPVTGGLPLLYPGESHLLYGDGGSGKSWLAQLAMHLVSLAGGLVLVIDYESNRLTLKARLKAMGVTKEQAGRIAYWRVTGSLMPEHELGQQFQAWCATYSPTLCVLDSVAKAMGAAGLNESVNSEFIRWESGVVNPLTQARITSLLIDHTGHQNSERVSTKVSARGASAKKDQVSGCAYHFETVDHWTKQSNGLAKLTCWKDREGNRKAGAVAAEMHVTVEDDGMRVSIELRAPETTTAGGRKYTWYMAFISDLVTEHGPLSGYAIEQHVKKAGKSKEYATEAKKSLIADGFAELRTGDRNAKVLHMLRPYVLAEQDPFAAQGVADPHEAAGVSGF